MSKLWVPPAVSRDLVDDGERDRQEVLQAAVALKSELDAWNRELKQIDERLQMVWFDEGVDILGVVPCRYHILRLNDPPTPPSVIPVTGPAGEFREPDSAIFDELRSSDMWSQRAIRDRKRAQDEITRAKERARQRETEERREHLRDLVNAATRATVSMTDAAPWSQNVSGQKGVRSKTTTGGDA